MQVLGIPVYFILPATMAHFSPKIKLVNNLIEYLQYYKNEEQ